MSLFSRRYEKEGPGVDPDEPEKGPFGSFFDNYFSKFWRICGLGILATLASILTIAILYFAGLYLLPMLFPSLAPDQILKSISALNLDYAEGIDANTLSSHLFLSTHFIFIMLIFSLQYFVTGPCHAAITYVMRNFAFRQPVFLWSDLKDAFLANWKQSLIHSIISSLLISLVIFASYFYKTNLEPGFLLYFVNTLMIMIMIILTLMQFYVYPMLVTFDLKLKDIYKNALIMTFIKLPSNFGILLILIILGGVIPFLLIWAFPGQGVAALVFIYEVGIYIGTAFFLINHFVSRGMKKYLLSDDDNKHGHDDNDDSGSASSVDDPEAEVYQSDWHYSEEIPQEQKGELPAGAPA